MQALVCHMTLTLEDGSVAENTKSHGQPVRFNLGDQSLSPEFEAELQGLAQGDRHQFTLPPAATFGEVNPDAIQHLDRNRFAADMTLEPGVIVSFTGPNGAEYPGIIREVAGDSVTVDLNHPLAGQTVTFEIEVIEAVE